MKNILSDIMVFFEKHPWTFFVPVHVLFRLPYFLHSEQRLIGDEVIHWLLNENNFRGNHFSLRPYGHDYLGVTDSLFVYPFALIFGNNGFSQQLGLLVVYFLFAFFLYRIAVLAGGRRIGALLMVYLTVPGPFLMALSAVYLSGHFSATMLFAGSTCMTLKAMMIDEKKTHRAGLYLAGGALLLGFSYYTSHLLMIGAIALGILWLILLVHRAEKGKLLIYLSMGLLAGMIPEWASYGFRATESLHYSGSIKPGFDMFVKNAYQFIHYGVHAYTGLLSHPYMGIYGFDQGGTIRTFSNLYSWLVFVLVAWFAASTSALLFVSWKEKRQETWRVFVFFSGLLIGGNVLALLAVSISDDFAIRYLIPSVAFAPILILLSYQHLKSFKPRMANTMLILFFLFLFAGYIRGYSKEKFYNFTGAENQKLVLETLQEHGVTHAFASYWIAFHLMKNTDLKFQASPSIQMGSAYYPELYQRVKGAALGGEKFGLVVLQNGGDFTEAKVEVRGGTIKLEEGIFAVLEAKKVNPWVVYILKYER